NRYDIVLALFIALGLACLGRRWILASGLFFGTAAAVKVFPVVLVPLVLRYLWPERRQVVLWLAGFSAALAAFFVPRLLRQDWQAVWGPFQFQLSRPPMGPTIYGHLLPQALEGEAWYAQAFRLGSVLLTALGLALTRPPDLAAVLGRGAIVVIVF